MREVGRDESPCQREADLRELQSRAPQGRDLRGVQQSPPQAAAGLVRFRRAEPADSRLVRPAAGR